MNTTADQLPFDGEADSEVAATPSDLGAPRFEDIKVDPKPEETASEPGTEPVTQFSAPVQSPEAVGDEGMPYEPPVDPSARPSDFVDTDRVGTVFPGDVGGWANLAVRLLGQGDSGNYTGSVVDRVKYLQAEAGMEPDGIIRGGTWALILRPLKVGASGEEVLILCRLLGIPDSTVFTSETADAVQDLQVRASLSATGKLDPETWYAALTA